MARSELQVLPNREGGEQRTVLGHERDAAPGDAMGATTATGAPRIETEPLIGGSSPAIVMRVVVLPAAVRSEQYDDFAGVNVQVEIADDGDAVVAGVQAVDVEQRRHRASDAVFSPRYAAMTRSSARTSAGVPCAMTRPNSRT